MAFEPRIKQVLNSSHMNQNNLPLIFTLVFALLFLKLQAQPESYFRVNFDLAEANLNEAAAAKIASETKGLTARGNYHVQLIGHTDRSGSLEYNQALSEQRATSVEKALIDLGFSDEKIDVEGQAFLQPLNESEKASDLALNRRVEVIIESTEWNVPSAYYSIPTQDTAEIIYERSGSKIEIPPNAFTYADGRPVKGEVLVQYREFRDAADFIASRIPMQLNHKGAPAYFNSTGMFEVRAYDEEGTSLNLNPDKSLTIDFVQTQIQDKTQFWRFDEEKQTWEEGDKKVTFPNAQMVNVFLGKDRTLIGHLKQKWPDKNYWKDHPDTIAQLQKAYELLPKLLASSERYGTIYLPELDLTTFDQRFGEKRIYNRGYAGLLYTGNMKFRDAYKNKQYYNIVFKSKWGKRGKLYFGLEDKSGENEELKPFEDYYWIVRTKDLTKMRRKVRGTKFSDIRIERKKNNKRVFVIKLKYKTMIYSLDARLYTKEDGPVKQTIANTLFQEYSQKLNARRKAFDEVVAANKEHGELIWPCVKLLLPRTIEDNIKKETGLRMAVNENGKRKSAWPNIITRSESSVNYMAGYYFLSRYGTSFKKELTGKKRPNWRALMTNFEEEVYSEKSRYMQIEKSFSDPVPRLQLSGLGIFNCDVLFRFEDEKHLEVHFEDEKGEAVEFTRIEVVNHRLNGLSAFVEPQIYLDLEAPTTLIVYAKDGRILYLSAKKLKKLDLSNEEKFTFSVEDIGDYTGNPMVFRKLLNFS